LVSAAPAVRLVGVTGLFDAVIQPALHLCGIEFECAAIKPASEQQFGDSIRVRRAFRCT
jgi:hypothetical protein